MTKKSKQPSTFEREMQDASFKQAFDKEYHEFALAELIAAMAGGDVKSVRALAKETGLHPNAIQNLKSGKTADIKMKSFLKIVTAYGYTLELVKGKTHIPVHLQAGESDYAMAG